MHDAQAKALEKSLSLPVVRPLSGLIVNTPFKFNHEPQRTTIEIHNESVDHMLTSELETRAAVKAQQLPGPGLCWRWRPTQFSRAVEQHAVATM